MCRYRKYEIHDEIISGLSPRNSYTISYLKVRTQQVKEMPLL